VGYAVLGRLLEEAHGRSWDVVLRDEVWAPLGMTGTGRAPDGPPATGYAVHPHADVVLVEPVASYGAMGPAGEVWSTPADLVRFGSWLVDAARRGDDVVLPVAWRHRMTAPRVVVDDPGVPFTGAWGLGVSVRHPSAGAARRTVGHGGSVPGFTASLRADPATGDVVAVCGSSTAGFGDVGFLLDLLDGPAGRPGRAPGASDPAVDPATVALTGTWYWGPMPHTLALRPDGLLELSASGGVDPRGTVFAPAGENGWVGVEGGYWLGERLRVVGRGTAAEALDVGTFHLTRTPYDRATAVPGGVDPAGWRTVPVPSAADRDAGS
jgi:hypothetical protein